MHDGRGTQDPSRGTGCWLVGKEGIVIIMVVTAVVALVGVIVIAANIRKSSRRAVVGSSCNSSRRSCSSSRICSSSSRSRVINLTVIQSSYQSYAIFCLHVNQQPAKGRGAVDPESCGAGKRCTELV